MPPRSKSSKDVSKSAPPLLAIRPEASAAADAILAQLVEHWPLADTDVFLGRNLNSTKVVGVPGSVDPDLPSRPFPKLIPLPPLNTTSYSRALPTLTLNLASTTQILQLLSVPDRLPSVLNPQGRPSREFANRSYPMFPSLGPNGGTQEISEEEREEKRRMLSELKDGVWARVMVLQSLEVVERVEGEEESVEDEVKFVAKTMRDGKKERLRRETILKDRLDVMLDICTLAIVAEFPLDYPDLLTPADIKPFFSPNFLLDPSFVASKERGTLAIFRTEVERNWAVEEWEAMTDLNQLRSQTLLTQPMLELKKVYSPMALSMSTGRYLMEKIWLPHLELLETPSHPHPRSILEHHDDGELMDDDHWDTQSTSRQQSAAAAAVQPSAKRQTRSTSKQPSASTSAPSARASSSHTRNRSTSAQPPLDSSKQPSSKCSTKRKPEAVVEEGEEEVDELAEEEEDNAAGAVEEQDGTGDDGQEEDDNVAPSPPRARKAARKISQPPNFDSLTSTSSASTSSPSSPSTANLHAAASNQRSQDDDAVMQMLSDAPDREEGEEDEDQTQQEEEEVDPDQSLLIYARPFPAKKQTTLVPDSDGSSSNLARPPTLSPPLSPSSLSNEELAQSANRQARPPHATSSSSLRQPAESSDEHESETEIERLARIAKRAGKRRAIFPPSSRSQRLPSRSLSPPARTSRTTNSKLRSRSRSRSYRRRSPAPDEEEDDEAEDLEDDAPSGTPHSSAREIVSEKAKQRRNRGVKDKELLSLKVLSAEMGPDFGGGRGGLEEVVWGMLQRGYKLEDIVEKTRRVVEASQRLGTCLAPGYADPGPLDPDEMDAENPEADAPPPQDDELDEDEGEEEQSPPPSSRAPTSSSKRVAAAAGTSSAEQKRHMKKAKLASRRNASESDSTTEEDDDSDHAAEMEREEKKKAVLLSHLKNGRRSWTEEEDYYLLKGMKQVYHSTNMWAKIAALYGRNGVKNNVLKYRDSKSLRDRARNIKTQRIKTGETLPEFFSTTPLSTLEKDKARATAAQAAGLPSRPSKKASKSKAKATVEERKRGDESDEEGGGGERVGPTGSRDGGGHGGEGRGAAGVGMEVDKDPNATEEEEEEAEEEDKE